MKNTCVVIGAGIIGASCAWHLQEKGLQVTLIDEVMPGQSCSFGNASCLAISGIVPLSYPGLIRKLPGWLLDSRGPVKIRMKDFPSLLPWFWRFWRSGHMQVVEETAAAQAQLMRRATSDYDDILNAIGLAGLKQARGCIHIYDSEKDYLEDQWQVELSARFGFDAHRLSRSELKSMVPSLKLGGGVALMQADWQHLLDPAKVTGCIAQDCFSNGGVWVQDRVSSVNAERSGIRIKTTSGQQIDADQLVVAAGAWSNFIAQQLDNTVPLVAKRGYHSMIAKPGIDLDYPVMSVNRSFIMTPQEGGLRVAGTAEFAALDAVADYRRARVLLQHASDYLDGLNTDNVTEWMGQRPMLPDSKPVISTSPRHRNVFYAFGHGHYGITQGPTTGRIIADMVVGEASSIDLSAFRFDRFS